MSGFEKARNIASLFIVAIFAIPMLMLSIGYDRTITFVIIVVAVVILYKFRRNIFGRNK